jgi:hypothetical protein
MLFPGRTKAEAARGRKSLLVRKIVSLAQLVGISGNELARVRSAKMYAHRTKMRRQIRWESVTGLRGCFCLLIKADNEVEKLCFID